MNEKNVNIDAYPIDEPGDAESLRFLDDKPHYTWELRRHHRSYIHNKIIIIITLNFYVV